MIDPNSEVTEFVNSSSGIDPTRTSSSIPLLPFNDSIENHLVIIGPTSSGKSTIGQYFETQSNVRHIEASSILRRLLNERGEKMTPSKIKGLFKPDDKAKVAKQVVELVSIKDWTATVITGFRMPEELEYILSELSNVAVVRVSAPRWMRLNRALQNKEGSRSVIMDDFEEKEALENDLGLHTTLLRYPERVVENAAGPGHLKRQLVGLSELVYGREGTRTFSQSQLVSG